MPKISDFSLKKGVLFTSKHKKNWEPHTEMKKFKGNPSAKKMRWSFLHARNYYWENFSRLIALRHRAITHTGHNELCDTFAKLRRDVWYIRNWAETSAVRRGTDIRWWINEQLRSIQVTHKTKRTLRVEISVIILGCENFSDMFNICFYSQRNLLENVRKKTMSKCICCLEQHIGSHSFEPMTPFHKTPKWLKISVKSL